MTYWRDELREARVRLNKLPIYQLLTLFYAFKSPDEHHLCGDISHTNLQNNLTTRILNWFSAKVLTIEKCENFLKSCISISQIKATPKMNDYEALKIVSNSKFHFPIAFDLYELVFIEVNCQKQTAQTQYEILKGILNSSDKIIVNELDFVIDDKDLLDWSINFLRKNSKRPFFDPLDLLRAKVSNFENIQPKLLLGYFVRQMFSDLYLVINSDDANTESSKFSIPFLIAEKTALIAKLKAAYIRRKSRKNPKKLTREYSFTMSKSLEEKLNFLSKVESMRKAEIIERLVTEAYFDVSNKRRVFKDQSGTPYRLRSK